MLCSITQAVCVSPVVGATTGLIYDKSTVEKALLGNGERCPITNLPLSLKELIPMRQQQPAASLTAPPRALEAASIPSLLRSFQNEWDAMALEVFSLKQQLEKTRRELAVALYENDAAGRVIHRLTLERDEARRGVAVEAQPQPQQQQQRHEMEQEAAATTTTSVMVVVPLTPEETQRISDQDAALQAERNAQRKRAKTTSSSAAAEVAALTTVKELGSGALCIDAWGAAVQGGEQADAVLAWGGADKGRVHVTSRGRTAIVLQLDVDGGQVEHVALVRADALLAASGSDVHLVRFGGDDGSSSAKKQAMITLGAAPVAALTRHTHTGEYAFALDRQGEWSFLRCESAQVAARGQSSTTSTSSQYQPTLAAHPDGKLFATAGGNNSGELQIWDVLRGQPAGALQTGGGGITQLDFCDNGIHLGVLKQGGSGGGGVVEIWDLRKPQGGPVHTYGPGSSSCLAFGSSMLCVASSSGSLELRHVVGKGSGEWPLAAATQSASYVKQARVLPGGSSVLTLQAEGVVRVWSS